MSKKRWKRKYMGEKLKTNHRSREHNLSHIRHLPSHTPLMFCDFTDKLWKWASLIKPARVTINLCSHERSIKLQTQLVRPRAVGIWLFSLFYKFRLPLRKPVFQLCVPFAGSHHIYKGFLETTRI